MRPMDLPHEDSLRFLVARYAHLRAAHGGALGEPLLLEPSGRHFPDEFTGDMPSVARLLNRMIAYAPLAEDLPIDLAAAPSDEEQAGGGCGTGGCGTKGDSTTPKLGRVVELDDRYRVELAKPELGHPVLLAAALARSVGALVLAEAGEEVEEGELGAMSEIAATASGFGLLLIGGSALYAKACGGLRMHRVTHLSVNELAVLLALFVKVHDKKPASARKNLETTQSESFDEAMRWVDSNEALVARLRALPESLEGGAFAIEPTKSLLGRWFQKKSEADAPIGFDAASVRAPRAPRSEAEQRRLAEAKALVEEALREA